MKFTTIIDYFNYDWNPTSMNQIWCNWHKSSYRVRTLDTRGRDRLAFKCTSQSAHAIITRSDIKCNISPTCDNTTWPGLACQTVICAGHNANLARLLHRWRRFHYISVLSGPNGWTIRLYSCVWLIAWNINIEYGQKLAMLENKASLLDLSLMLITYWADLRDWAEGWLVGLLVYLNYCRSEFDNVIRLIHS